MKALWQDVADRLFPQGHAITESAHFLSGTAQVDGRTVAVIGTTDHVPIGVEIALAQAEVVLQTVRSHPGRPILILVDTQGQRLRHRDEMLGINSYMAHLGKCIELARQQGHAVLALVYDQALSGGFITSGLMADACFALPAATIRVMGLPAMARITKVPEQRLNELAVDNPVFAPGPENYLRMGGIEAIWDGDLAAQLVAALAQDLALVEAARAATATPGSSAAADDATPAGLNAGTAANPHGRINAGVPDRRSATGAARGGRKLAQPVIDAVRNADAATP